MTDNLTFNVAQLLKDAIVATRTGQVEVALRDLTPDLIQSDEAPDGAIAGPVRLMHIDLGVLVQGDLRGQVTLGCARCLEPVAVPLAVRVEEVFTPTIDLLTGKAITPEEEDRALWIDERHILDLTEVLRQNVLLAVPLHVLCRQECRGLCPTCGKNLNEGPCHCEPEPDPRWAVLAGLLQHSDS